MFNILELEMKLIQKLGVHIDLIYSDSLVFTRLSGSFMLAIHGWIDPPVSAEWLYDYPSMINLQPGGDCSFADSLAEPRIVSLCGFGFCFRPQI